jgi:Uncharacterized protein conserved in bacteria (DUF2272)/Phage tail lysozyme
MTTAPIAVGGSYLQRASPLCERIAEVALEQFRRWRPGGTALVETSPAASPILREYYRVGVGTTVTDADMQSSVFQDAHPWSAVFISYVVKTAGGAPTAFAYSAAHQTYIRAARQNRLSGNTASPFWAFRATEVAPRRGDLVCASRMNSGATYDNIGDPQYRATHCDVVVETQPGRIRVIGGNVGQTVGEKWLSTLPDGRLSLTGPQSTFFAVIRCGSGVTAPPAPAPTPAMPGEAGRVLRVMQLLVNRYGYPVNGAAGLVGNLIAESGVQPNRIEGSRSATPMRAPDFAGRLRDWTPDQVRDRSYSRRTGPRHPGVGIAQWTSPDRRRGLFRHRQLGSAILSDLDAQVDYLVTELRGAYRQVDAVLRSPGVTLEQASDAVLLRFERPASVLNRPRTDPGVQSVISRRRAHGARARQIFRAARMNQLQTRGM